MNDDEQRTNFHQYLKNTVARYLERFPDEKSRTHEFVTHLSNAGLDLRLRSTIPEGHVCASGIILLPNNKVLMLKHKALGIWVVPGGHYDLADLDLVATAIRETTEETSLQGVKLHPWHREHGIPLDIDTHPIPERKEKHEGAHQHFDFRYILTVDQPETLLEQLELDSNEILDFEAVDISEIDASTSIYPALQKLPIIFE